MNDTRPETALSFDPLITWDTCLQQPDRSYARLQLSLNITQAYRTYTHSIELSGERIASYGEGRSTLDFPLIHDTQSQDQP
jgi:hypothetical protein